jgi:hypothetical protein
MFGNFAKIGRGESNLANFQTSRVVHVQFRMYSMSDRKYTRNGNIEWGEGERP